MTERTDLYGSYARFGDRVLAEIRAEAFGEDIGQNSWLTSGELDRFAASLALAPGSRVLEVASGSGGPALRLARTTGCRVVGIDADENAVATAARAAAEHGLSDRAAFRRADANSRLPFEDGTFDALVCIDALNHFADRLGVLREWCRVLRPGARAVVTDPVVLTGPVTHDELAQRSSIGFFLFVPPGVNERLIDEAGLRLVQRQDVTDDAACVAGRWLRARAAREAALRAFEGAERFLGLQRFLATVERLAAERRLSRFAYLVEKPTRPDTQARLALGESGRPA